MTNPDAAAEVAVVRDVLDSRSAQDDDATLPCGTGPGDDAG